MKHFVSEHSYDCLSMSMKDLCWATDRKRQPKRWKPVIQGLWACFSNEICILWWVRSSHGPFVLDEHAEAISKWLTYKQVLRQYHVSAWNHGKRHKLKFLLKKKTQWHATVRILNNSNNLFFPFLALFIYYWYVV